MKRLTLLLSLTLLAVHLAASAEDPAITFHVQLIRGTNLDEPQNASWKPIGPRLSKRLSPVFRWKGYWEVSRHIAKVQPGKTTRIRLSKEREVEIKLINQDKAEVRLFLNGKLNRTSKQSVDTKISVLGGDKEMDESWFVVVRRDKPQ
jgi:hypothetical protein